MNCTYKQRNWSLWGQCYMASYQGGNLHYNQLPRKHLDGNGYSKPNTNGKGVRINFWKCGKVNNKIPSQIGPYQMYVKNVFLHGDL